MTAMILSTATEALVRQPAAQAVGWALLQFVWQGAAVAALTALALAALRRSAADVRYVVASIGLALMFTLPLVTGAQKFQSLRAQSAAPAARDSFRLTAEAARPRAGSPSAISSPPGSSASPQFAASAASLKDFLTRLLPEAILAWLAGVTVLTLRLMTGWLWVQRLRTHGVSRAEPSWERMLVRLSRRLHIRRTIALLESAHVDVPTVIGWVKPVVLLPASALGGLAPLQLEAILAHELAHIRRHDYLVNLLQTLVETLLFYHPAVWWLSRRIRIERENCCDDLAVSLCGDPVAYANALADLESLRSSTPPFRRIDRVAMAATGGSLLGRVQRLLGAPASHAGRGPAWLAGSVAVVLIGGIALSADRLRDPQTAASREPAQPAVAARPAAPSTPLVRAEESAAAAAAAASTPPPPARAQAEPAVPAAAAAGAVFDQSISEHSSGSHGSWSWSNDGEKLEVTYSGEFEFTDDDSDVRQLSPGGSLKISDGAWLGRHSVEIRERNGQLERRYFVNASERPFEPEGRVWLHQNLPKFVRNTGIGAPARVARILKSGGIPAIFAEIDRIDGSYVKGIYFRELFKQATLTPEQYRQALTVASRDMRGSDYELAQLLIAIADRLPNDEASRSEYFTAASGLSSDYERRRVYSAMLKRGPISPQLLSTLLDHSRSFKSDYEVSELLRQILSQQSLDERNYAAFFAVVSGIHSDYERHRVLSVVVNKDRASDPALLQAALAQAEKLGSDYEKGTFLHEVLKQNDIEGSLRAPFFRVAAGLSSGYERGRLLQAVARRPDASRETVKAVLQAAKGMSGYDLSQVLISVANTHVLTGDLRDAYLDAADRLSGYDQGQVMTALVRSERRK
ncbi:MAG TPA: M56 family metallopeptidase [Vicinamibacterales bacterium]|nr:M56 family metallopeptidase [Vicinamibacterales bacterium]